MFRKLIVATLLATTVIYGCKKSEVRQTPTTSQEPTAPTGGGGGMMYRGVTDADYSASIPVDSANRMIESYLYSINYPAKDSLMRSFSVSADSLRAYLNNPNIKNVKFMLAHNPEYINSGHFGEYAGLNPVALTFVIVGTSTTGDYVLNPRNEVYEHVAPCPVFCSGSASPYILK